MHVRLCLIVAAVGGALFPAASATALGFTFEGLGFLSGDSSQPAGQVAQSVAYGVSADGSVVVGASGAVLGASSVFRWTVADGMTDLGIEGDARGVSADGAVIVGAGTTTTSPRPGAQFQAFRWTESGGAVLLGSNSRRAYGVSADGSIVVGQKSGSEGVAFRWTETGGVQSLGFLWNLPEWGDLSAATAVSADGSVVVGNSSSQPGTQAFRWTQAGGMQGLGDFQGGNFNSGARGASANGSVIVGYGNTAAGAQAFRWTASGGLVGLGDLAGGGFSSLALGVSADGSVAVGQGTTDAGTEAFLWDAANGMRRLQNVLEDGGLDLTGWTLTSASAISADGSTIVGVGANPVGHTEAWRATLPVAQLVATPGDFDRDGDIDGADFLAWQSGASPNHMNQDDLNQWTTSFGVTATASAVPEPGSVALAIFGVAALSGMNRRLRPRRLTVSLAAVLALCGLAQQGVADTFGSGANQFTIDFVTIGSPGNAADAEGNPSPAGAVGYEYRISTHEISEHMIQSAVAAAGLDISWGPKRGPDKPATGVSWVEAAVFINWLNESVGASPAYKITPPPPPFADPVYNLWAPGDAGYDPANPYRNTLARYVLPNTDEWYKAAYYDPVGDAYFDFPIGRNAAPQSVVSGTDPFTAVFNRSDPADRTQAGGLSPWGTMGQGGNAFELVETAHDGINDAVHEPRQFRGGYWQQGADDMKRFERSSLSFGPYSFGAHIGFRVASVVPPGAALGDFDSDGDADGADFLAWQRGQSPMPFSDQDLNQWRGAFGLASTTLAATATVPEPAALGMALVGLIALRRRSLR